MRSRDVSALALAIATCFSGRAFGLPEEPPAELPALGAAFSSAALIAAGVAAAALLASRAGASDGAGETAGVAPPPSSAPPAESAPAGPSRTLVYTSPADFRSAEYAAQAGLQAVKADVLYFNGHYRWYAGELVDPAAGTGGGVKIAVADTGINAAEAATASAIAIDGLRSYDYVNDRPGSAADDSGHGTHVAGIIAAPKNGAGMHGLAYNASIVNFKVADAQGRVAASDAQLADMLQRSAAAGAMIVNNSWASHTAITAYSRQEVEAWLPRMIDASRAYVAGGGVVVFAAGNDAAAQPSVQSGLPYRVAGIEPGWLAVVAIDGSGALAGYSNRCGVAAAWCLAAPGGAPDAGLYSMQNNGGYAAMYGTSMAAPHVSAALGALKSMFPNLSIRQIRERLLHTANRSGAYGDASAYGQGLLDLAAATSPVGGVAVPMGALASGPVAPVEGSAIRFPAGALRAMGMQGWVLVLDNYQRAPFWLPAHAFFQEAPPRLVERHFASLRSGLGDSPGLERAVSADVAGYRLGFSSGAGGEAELGLRLGLAWVPRLAAPEVDSFALGTAAMLGGLRIGLLGTLPAPQASEERTLGASPLGSRRALGLVAQRGGAGSSYGLSLAFADGFEHPIGLATGGAFAVEGASAISSGFFLQRTLGDLALLDASLELAHHRPESSAALVAPSYTMRAFGFGARTRLGPKTTLSARLAHEWSGGEAARLHVPLTIGEGGDIGRAAYALPYDDLVGRTALSLRLDHALARQVDLRLGLTQERDGFGASLTGVAAMLAIRL